MPKLIMGILLMCGGFTALTIGGYYAKDGWEQIKANRALSQIKSDSSFLMAINLFGTPNPINHFFTKPIEFSDQPDFVNGAFHIHSQLSSEAMVTWLKNIEKKLGRVKTSNKNGPRTIDLDIIVYNGSIIDQDYYSRNFLKKSVQELLPDLL